MSVFKRQIFIESEAVIDSQVDVHGNRNILSSTDLQTNAQGGTLSGEAKYCLCHRKLQNSDRTTR